MNEMKSLTLNGKTYDVFVDPVARANGGTPVTAESIKNALGYTPADVTDVFDSAMQPNFTNIFDAVAIEYGKVMNSDGSVSDTAARMCVTDFIPIKAGDVIRVNEDFQLYAATGSSPMIAVFDSEKTYKTHMSVDKLIEGGYYIALVEKNAAGNVVAFKINKPSNAAYVRVSNSTTVVGTNPILTINELIEYGVGYGTKLNRKVLVDYSQITDAPVIKNGWSILPHERLSICYSGINRKPINTVEHFTDAAENFGYNALKCDVRPTSDGELICCHDAGFTFDGNGYITAYNSSNQTLIHDVTAATCLGYSFKTGEHPCLVGDYLDVCRKYGKIAFVTIRDEYMDVVIPKLLEELRIHNMTYSAIINSMSYESLMQWRQQDKNVMTNYTLYYGVAIDKTQIDRAVGLGYCTLSGFSLSSSSTDPSASCDFEYARANGIRLLEAIAYKEGSPEACYAMGYDGVTIGIPWGAQTGRGSAADAVLYTEQVLTPEQQEQVRKNIDAASTAYVDKAVANAIGGVDLSEYQQLGMTPQRLNGAEKRYDVVVDATEETVVTISSDTVADLSTAKDVRYQNVVETYENGVYELSCTKDGSPWYQTRKHFKIDNLVPGESYRLMFDVTGVVETDLPSDVVYYAQIAVMDADLQSLFSDYVRRGNGIKHYSFTATTSTATVYIYPANSSLAPVAGMTIRYRDVWINKASAVEVRTEVYQNTVTTEGRLVIKDIGGGMTIESTPSANIYTQIIGGDEPTGPLAGMTCVCFGDSITGNYVSPFDYPSIIAKATGMNVINGGFGGCRMAQHPSSGYTAFSMYSLANSVASGDWAVQDDAIDSVESVNAVEHLAALKEVDWSTVDFITIFYGTNDFMGGVAIGEDDGSMNTSQFKGALRHSIETILTAYPNIRIVLLTPIYRFWKENETVTDSDTREVSGLKLTDFVEAVVAVAEEYKLPAFKLYDSLGINKINRTVFLADGVHPSESGLDRIGKSIAARLTSI